MRGRWLVFLFILSGCFSPGARKACPASSFVTNAGKILGRHRSIPRGLFRVTSAIRTCAAFPCSPSAPSRAFEQDKGEYLSSPVASSAAS